MGKNVAVFVDVANIFYAAKAAGVDIDYVTLLKSASAGRDLVRAYAYTGLDPDNENQRNFHDFLRRSNYKVVSKDIRKYGDGKVKANLDIELVVDMMKTARNLDIAIVVSGDGDFAPAIRAVQEQGVRVEVISFRGNTSSDLIEVADQFTDIIQLATRREGLALGPTRLRGRRGPLDDRGAGQADRGDRRGSRTWPRPWSRTRRRGGAGARRHSWPRARTAVRPMAAPVRGRGGRGAGHRRAARRATVARAGALSRGRPRVGRGLHARRADDDASGADGRSAAADRRSSRSAPRARSRAAAADVAVAVVVAAAVAATESRRPSADRPRRAPASGSGDSVADADVRSGRRGGRRDRRRAAGPRPTPFGSVWDSQLGTPAPPSRGALKPLTTRTTRRAGDPRVPDRRAAPGRPNRGGAAGRARRTARRPGGLPVGDRPRALRTRRGRRRASTATPT